MVSNTLSFPSTVTTGTYTLTVFFAEGCSQDSTQITIANTSDTTSLYDPTYGFSWAVPPLLSSWPSTDSRTNYVGGAVGPGKIVLNNGVVEAQMWEGYGGTIGHVSKAGGLNMFNQFDHGRGADDGVYTSPEPNYSQNGKSPNPNWPGLGYNPLGIGDSYNNGSQVVAKGLSADGKTMYSKAIMKLWPLNNENSDLKIERWCKLNNNAVEVYRKITSSRSDKTWYPADLQERPCMMITGSHRRIAFYNGSKPFTNAQITITDGYENGSPHQQVPFHVTEPWIAVEHDNGNWIALWAPMMYSPTYTHYAQGDIGTREFDNACTYTANTPLLIIDSDNVMYHRHSYIIGSLQEIRNYVYAQKRLTVPNYTFNKTNGRCDWHVWKGTDQKEPFTSDGWNCTFVDHESKLVSPVGSWNTTSKSTIKIDMEYTGERSQLFLLALKWGQKMGGLDPDHPAQEAIRWPNGTISSAVYDEQTIFFNVKGDGTRRTYTIDLSTKPALMNTVLQQFEIGYHYSWAGLIKSGERIKIYNFSIE